MLAGWEPAGLGLTHFGGAEDAPAQLAAVREALHAQIGLLDESGGDQQKFIEGIQRRTREHAGQAAEPILQAAPPDHLFLGLKRWSDKLR